MPATWEKQLPIYYGIFTILKPFPIFKPFLCHMQARRNIKQMRKLGYVLTEKETLKNCINLTFLYEGKK